jgi:Tetratricopeptide repeat
MVLFEGYTFEEVAKGVGVSSAVASYVIRTLQQHLHKKQRQSEAELLIARSLCIHEQSLGATHPYMAYSFYNLTDNFSLRKNYEKAEFHYKKALANRNSVSLIYSFSF